MIGDDGKQPEVLPDATELEEEATEEEIARDAAGDMLVPSMPPAGAGMMLEVDPRLNRPSESEAELKELVNSNEDAEAEEAEDKDASDKG